MRRLVLPPRTRQELNAILRHIARQSGSAAIALQFVGLLREQCVKLASLPGTLGRPRPEMGADIRSFAYRGYIIFFRYDANTLRVINVIEGHRDLGQHIDDDQV